MALTKKDETATNHKFKISKNKKQGDLGQERGDKELIVTNIRANTKNLFVLTPMFGILVFAVLYAVAAFYYPGGSSVDKTTIGFDWLHNYWCDLTGQLAKNGEVNTARPFALSAMIVLCSSLAVFWLNVSRLFGDDKFNQVIRFTGISSMAVAVFLFTGYHDAVINVAGALGIVALSGFFIGLYKNNLIILFGYGVFCLAFMLFNYFIYKTSFLLSFLPVIQKVTFVLFLLWICCIVIYHYRTIDAKSLDEQIRQI